MPSLLLVDDDLSLTETLRIGLVRRGYPTSCCSSVSEALAFLELNDVDVVVTDLNMKGQSGIELCTEMAARHRDIPTIVLTAFGNYETAVSAIRAGAYDFISKPVQLDVLSIAIERAAQHRALHQEVKRLRLDSGSRSGMGELIGPSPALDKLRDLIARVADSEASILITGESGTGKEVVARATSSKSA